MEFYLVDVKDITSDIPRSNFAESDLENLADIIIETGGIIKPLVVKSLGAESYTVVDGHFEYYAAVRAKEKNPRKAEMVNAFVIPAKLENLIVQQIAVIEKAYDHESSNITSNTSNSESSRLTNLELRFERQFNEMKSELIQESQRINDKFRQLEKLIPQKSEHGNPLDLLNTLDINELNAKLQRSRVSGYEKLSKAIGDARRKKPKHKFEDYRDVMKSVKGLGIQTILTIIDEWSRS